MSNTKAFSTREVGKLLRLPICRLHRAMQEERLSPPALRIGGNFVWSESDLDRAARLFLGRSAADLLAATSPTGNVAAMA
jgi:hypothetical protein